MGRVLHNEQPLLDQRGIMRVSHIYNKFGYYHASLRDPRHSCNTGRRV